MLRSPRFRRLTGMVVVVVGALLAAACSGEGNEVTVDHNALPLIPRPVSVNESTGTAGFALTAHTRIVAASGDAVFAAHELAKFIEKATSVSAPVISAADATASDAESGEDHETNDITLTVADKAGPARDEGYRLTVVSDAITIEARTAAGLYWGTQTLRQLLPTASGGGADERARSDATPSIRSITIEDHPRYAYRGLMLDVARHFFDVSDVQGVIEDAAAMKLNYLHLHLTDDQGWRLEIPGWPELTTAGAQTAVDGDPGGYYTTADYQAIVEYAAARHITVVPEIDMPGHTNAAMVAYPHLACDGEKHEPYTGIKVGFSSLCIEKETTYDFVRDVTAHLASITPGPYLHIGGDEALEMTDEAYLAFTKRASAIAAETGKTIVGWHEMGKSNQLPRGTIGQYWDFVQPRGGAGAEALSFVEQGGAVILSPADAIYLDMKYDDSTELGLTWAGTTSLSDAYGWDPEHIISGLKGDGILGVEAALWTETVRTRTDIETLMYPRIAAAAEIAWSPAPKGKQHDFDDFRQRLGALSAQWAAAGIHFTAVDGVPWGGVLETSSAG